MQSPGVTPAMQLSRSASWRDSRTDSSVSVAGAEATRAKIAAARRTRVVIMVDKIQSCRKIPKNMKNYQYPKIAKTLVHSLTG